jgi:hypothetical protein
MGTEPTYDVALLVEFLSDLGEGQALLISCFRLDDYLDGPQPVARGQVLFLDGLDILLDIVYPPGEKT